MSLFQIGTNGGLDIDPIAYALEPFKKLWDRDKTKTKQKAIADIAFVYYTTDYRSAFFNTPEEERETEVMKDLNIPKNWTPDKHVREAQEFYRSMQRTPALNLLEDAIVGISKLSTYLRDISFDETEVNEKTGEVKPKHDIKKYADTIKQIPAIVNALNELRETVRKEQEAKKGLRGNRKKGMYMD